MLNKSSFCEILLTESVFIRFANRLNYDVLKNLAESVRKFSKKSDIVYLICDESQTSALPNWRARPHFVYVYLINKFFIKQIYAVVL